MEKKNKTKKTGGRAVWLSNEVIARLEVHLKAKYGKTFTNHSSYNYAVVDILEELESRDLYRFG